jgi:outer membrane protein TolC
MVDMLDVQTNLDAARADVVAREAAYLTSLARLSHQSGTILKDLEIEP